MTIRKSLTQMSDAELRDAIRDPVGPDYKGYREAAQMTLASRTPKARGVLPASNMSDLIARLEAGEGADRELDHAIHDALVYGRNGDLTTCSPEYTGSLDVAVALVEKMLPGKDWSVARDFDPGITSSATAFIEAPWSNNHDPQTIEGIARSPARALLIALLRSQEVP